MKIAFLFLTMQVDLPISYWTELIEWIIRVLKRKVESAHYETAHGVQHNIVHVTKSYNLGLKSEF